MHATDWLDLSTERCRQFVCDNIAALGSLAAKILGSEVILLALLPIIDTRVER